MKTKWNILRIHNNIFTIQITLNKFCKNVKLVKPETINKSIQENNNYTDTYINQQKSTRTPNRYR